MPSLVVSYKRAVNRLTRELEEYLIQFREKNIGARDTITTREQMTFADMYQDLQELQEDLGALENLMIRTQTAVHDLAAAYAQMQPSPNDEQEFELCATPAEEAIDQASRYITTLKARISGIKTQIERTKTTPNLDMIKTDDEEPPKLRVAKKAELPPVPIPTFNGDIWEWDNFWELFNSNVHSQDASDLQKFNYLINALRGDLHHY